MLKNIKQSFSPLEHLEHLLLLESKGMYPSFPDGYRILNTFKGVKKRERRELKRIEKFLLLMPKCTGAIITNQGNRIDTRKTTTDVIGRGRIVGSVTFVKSGQRRGIADVKATIKGMSVDIELKLIYKKGKDRQSDAQIKEEQRINDAGGIYLITSSFEDFWNNHFWTIYKEEPSMETTIAPSFIDVTNFCNEKGYDLLPINERKGVRVSVFKDGEHLKDGDKVFTDWQEAQKESYTKIYNALNK